MFRRSILCLLLLPAVSMAAEPPKPEEAPIAKPAPTREVVQQRLADAALAAMAKSSDAEAVAVSSKFQRKSDVTAGESRTEEQETARQVSALSRALTLAQMPNEFIDYQVVTFCLGLPKEPFCTKEDWPLQYANRNLDNVIGWLTLAGKEYATGSNAIAQVFLESAAKAKRSDWYYQRALALARRYVTQVEDGDAQPGDRDVAILKVASEVSLPPLQRLAQMCNPDPAGKLPDGRYVLCRSVAKILVAQARTNVEVDLGLRVQQRLDNGEKNEAAAKKWSDLHTARQNSYKFLWNSAVKYPPQSEHDARELAKFVDDLIAVGEVKATENALRRAGKSIEDFLPASSEKAK